MLHGRGQGDVQIRGVLLNLRPGRGGHGAELVADARDFVQGPRDPVQLGHFRVPSLREQLLDLDVDLFR